jgi:hypothetical protein
MTLSHPMAQGIFFDPTLGLGDQMRARVGEALSAAMQREGRTIMAKDFRGFGSPAQPFAEDLFDLVLATHARITMEHFLAAFGAELDRHSATLRSFLHMNSEEDGSFVCLEYKT